VSIRSLCSFDEFVRESGDYGALRDLPRTLSGQEADELACYLRSGVVVLGVMEIMPDVIDGSLVAESASLLTDGSWYWRQDLAHYVEKYHVALPTDFIDHVTSVGTSEVAVAELDVVAAQMAVAVDWSGGDPFAGSEIPPLDG